MARKQQGSATPATRALDAAGVPYRTSSYGHDASAASYGLEAAEKLGLPPEQVYKTLMVSVDGRLAVAMIPVAATLDLKRFAALMGGRRAAMAAAADAERRTGYVVGGISPLGQKHPSPAGLHAAALELESINVSGGRRGFEITLAPADLVRLTGARTGDIAVER